MPNADLERRLARIIQGIQTWVDKEGPETLTAEQQALLARLSSALPYLPMLQDAHIHVGQAEIAAIGLLREPPLSQLAENIVNDLEQRIAISRSTFRSVFASRSPASHLLLGVALHILALAAAIGFAAIAIDNNPQLSSAALWSSPVYWTILGGSAGAIISLVMRLREFALVGRWCSEVDPKLLFFTGFLKPVVGLVFALLAWAALQSGIVQVNPIEAGTESWVAPFAVAFVVGLVERFAPDVANRNRPVIARS